MESLLCIQPIVQAKHSLALHNIRLSFVNPELPQNRKVSFTGRFRAHFVLTQYPQSCTQAWWRHQMETFSAQLAICAGNSPVPGEFPAQRPVKQSFDVFFDLRLNKRLSKQWWGWWFETLSRPLWRHCNGKSHQKLYTVNTSVYFVVVC